MGRAWGCIQPPAPTLQPKALSEHVPVCKDLRLGRHRTADPSCSAMCTRLEVNSSRSGYSHQGRVPKVLQCSCDSRSACIFAFIDTGEHYPCCYIRPTLLLFLLRRTQWGFFLGFFFLSFFLISNIATTLLLQTLISVTLCASDILIPTAEPREYFQCYWRTVPPSSVCLCSILPTVVYTINACEDLSQYLLRD